MAKRFFLLPAFRKRRIRAIARECYIASGGDETYAEMEVRRRLEGHDRSVVFSQSEIETMQSEPNGSILLSALLGLAISLAVELIKYWFLQGPQEPPPTYRTEEPGGDDL